MAAELHRALQLAANGAQTFVAAGVINASVLVGPPAQALTPREWTIMLACAVHCLVCAALACLPSYRGHPGSRLRLGTTLSMHAATMLLPLCIDTVRIIYGGGGSSGGSNGSGGVAVGAEPPATGLLALAAVAARNAHALVVFGLAVCWLQTMNIAALGWPQMPAVHLALQSTKAALLVRRARTACRQYVGLDPLHAQAVRVAHAALRQVMGVLSPASMPSLDAAAAESDDAQQCQAVVWAVEASLCWALPTLLLWRWQLATLRRWVAVQRRAGGPIAGADAAAQVRRSLHGRLCEPVMRAVDGKGGTPAAVALAAVAGFVGALLLLPHSR